MNDPENPVDDPSRREDAQTDAPVPSASETDTSSSKPSVGLDDDWASALAEQTLQEGGNQAAGLVGDNDWAAALAEKTAATTQSVPDNIASDKRSGTPALQPTATVAAPSIFQPLSGEALSDNDSEIDLIKDIPVQLSVELGRTQLTIRNILQLGQGSVIELDGLAGEPMDIFVNGYLIAQGEVVVVDDKYGIRLTDIITPVDRLNRLSGKR